MSLTCRIATDSEVHTSDETCRSDRRGPHTPPPRPLHLSLAWLHIPPSPPSPLTRLSPLATLRRVRACVCLGMTLQWQSECMEHPTLWDQNLFKDVLKIGGLRFRPNQVLADKRLFLGYNSTITIGILPVSTFCSGYARRRHRHLPSRPTPSPSPFAITPHTIATATCHHAPRRRHRHHLHPILVTADCA